MAYERLGGRTLDYFPCRYGGSRLIFRGPERRLAENYMAIVGGTEVFGKFMEEPFPETMELLTGRQVINLGCVNAGLEAFETDRDVFEICSNACSTVIQLTSASTLSNRYYHVHRRRNDRFIRATDELQELFPEVDFSEIHFVGHLLSTLTSISPDRFDRVRRELRAEWTRRMELFVQMLPGRVVLLWMGEHGSDKAPGCGLDWLGPHFVNREMLEPILENGTEFVEIVATAEEIDAGRARMIFECYEEPAANCLLGPVVHQEVARRLVELHQ